MRKFFLLMVGIAMFQFTNAQVQVGAIIGVSTADINGPTDFVTVDDLKIQAAASGYGVHGGAYVHVKAGPVYVRAMPTLGSSRIDYSVEDLDDSRNLFNDVVEESFLKLDVPVLVGIKVLKVLRLQAGPSGSIVLNSSNELASVSGLTNTWDGMTWGFQAGVGLNIKKISVDVNWEGGLSKVGDNFTFAGQSFDTDSRQNRWVVSVGYRLIGG